MVDSKSNFHLNAFLVKEEFKNQDYKNFLAKQGITNSYNIDDNLNIEGKLFVKRTESKKPKWASLAETLAGSQLDELRNRSSSAVLLLRIENNTVAFSFGYGRFLIDHKYFISDFGIKTALNTLKHDSLRSVDLYTLEDQALQKKSQAVRESDISVFGIDVSRDVLRAVTGSAMAGVQYKNITGGDAVYSFNVEIEPSELPDIAAQLVEYYNQETYRGNFYWVDNIRRFKDKGKIHNLDSQLIEEVQNKNHEQITITIPEIIPWDTISGFSFTRSKKNISPTINSSDYLSNIDPDKVTIDMLKRDRLFVYDVHENETHHSIYNCIYFEVTDEEKTYLLFLGQWYEIDNDFMTRINNSLSEIPTSSINFPAVKIWKEGEKDKIETEGDYNERVSSELSFPLLDKKLVKSDKTTTSIELCDLLTTDHQFIHVKHRKGGSAGLSHLFAQGSVAAEILLGDRKFRKEARKVLRRINTSLQNIVPLDGFQSNNYEIIYLILGEDNVTLKDSLPFFSKVNLTKAYENLSQRGFKVSVSGAEKIEITP